MKGKKIGPSLINTGETVRCRRASTYVCKKNSKGTCSKILGRRSGHPQCSYPFKLKGLNHKGYLGEKNVTFII